MADEDPDELVVIEHPEIKVYGGPVPRHALPLWGAQGWKAATDADATAGAPRKAARSGGGN